MLDTITATSPLTASCRSELKVVPAGLGVNINEADEAILRAILHGRGERRIDSLVAALLDWRDGDDSRRPDGAEREWYLSQGRVPPRNGPFASLDELRLVRGFDTLAVDSLFTVESARIALTRAPLAVVASVPGFTEDVITRLAERRIRGEPFEDLAQLEDGMPAEASDALARNVADLTRVATFDPDAWIVTSEGAAPSSTLELRLVDAGSHAAITRRRIWP
jgi:type II secretory pathway component PulK